VKLYYKCNKNLFWWNRFNGN